MLSPLNLIHKLNFKPRKRFGQHFLVHNHSIDKILQFASLSPTDRILEIGPGLGALTIPMSGIVKKLWTVEIDADLVRALRNGILSPSVLNVEVIHADVLSLNFKKLIEHIGRPFRILGNLPYNISSPFLFKLLENSDIIDSAVIMLQAEVANRLLANVGTKDYGILTVLFQLKAKITKGFYLKPQEFFPVPKVGSMVILIDFTQKGTSFELTREEERYFIKIVKGTFGQRRKMLRRSLVNLAPGLKRVLPVILENCGINAQMRPEELTVRDFVKLTRALMGSAIRI